MSNIWFFENVNLFDLLCPHKFKAYQAKHTFKKYKKGEFIYFENDKSDKIYLIAEGKVKIGHYTGDARELTKAILSKGEIFGELALFGEEKREDFAQIIEDGTILCPMTIEMMQELMREHKDFSFKVYKFIGWRIKKLERRLESLVFKDVKSRLLDFIAELAEERGSSVGYETLIPHFFTQKDIADLIGTTRQTVATLLNDLKEANIINFDRKRILVRDLKALKRMSR
jgi:CRP/FNR family transcriptional regulator, cyclic AMP receptor protein